jgi:hypothetical protein
VLSDNQVEKSLRLMTRPASTKLTPEIAREVCLRAGSTGLPGRSDRQSGKRICAGVEGSKLPERSTLALEQVTAASKERVLDTLGGMASKLRVQLGESLATVQKFDVSLAQATTSSLEALKAYSLGVKANREKGAVASLPYHQRAIQLDPYFAMGYWAVGSAYASLAEVGRASEYYTKAYQLREHASERERLVITADYYQGVTGELEKAAQTIRRKSRAIHGKPQLMAIWVSSMPHRGNMIRPWRSLGKSCVLHRKMQPTRISSTMPLPCNVLTMRGRSFTRPRRSTRSCNPLVAIPQSQTPDLRA